MRSWDKYCEDTHNALVHFRDCIEQPVYFLGYIDSDTTYLNQVNFLLHPYWGKWVIIKVIPRRMTHSNIENCSDDALNERVNNWNLVVLRAMKKDTVQAFTEMRDIKGYTFNYSTRYTGILNAYGMHKPINRLGNAFNWTHVYYRNIIPME